MIVKLLKANKFNRAITNLLAVDFESDTLNERKKMSEIIVETITQL